MEERRGWLEKEIKSDRLMRVEDVAYYLNTSKSYAYRIVQSGQLPSLKIGRSVRVRPIDLEYFIQTNLRNPMNDN